MRRLTRISATQRSQRGISLLESLIALLVAALGILGIVGVQLRTLSDTQTSVRREQAIRMIEDLSERMKVNPNAMANMSSYISGWDDTSTPSKICSDVVCTGAELAVYDVSQWKAFLRERLKGDANLFVAAGEDVAANRRQLGVMIRWRENERKGADSDYRSAINAAADSGTAVSCGEGYTCHLQYIPVSARCAPYKGTSTARYFCPGV
ncbi:type IV pilus assembly protein PilV [Comamonas sp. BIGb0152]|uniref:type IV pilus modification protein PilV n=1 Tax=Comamonas sp. BIGb0152 TaxID=2940601 RepID=UPI00216705DA|nr:type IV pilus modification protein PilV [Comamonas sp. BIGb0152]MCS4294824.1 type IV pilus assembly protein PilV [Comamonas sp. BIGb0152]